MLSALPVPQMLQMMCELEDEPDWATSDDPDDVDDNDRYKPSHISGLLKSIVFFS
jgi:hypothetical protein